MSEAPKPDAGTNAGKPSDLELKIKELEQDNFKQREELRTYKSKIDSIQNEKRSIEESKLKEANDWKTLAEKYQQEAKEKLNELQSYKEKEKEGRKNSAILSELSRFNFDPQYTSEAFKLLEKTKVMIDDDTGRVYGADEVAKEFATKYQSFPWFKKTTSTANHSMPSSDNRATLDLKKMTKDELKEYWKKKLATRS